MSWVATGIFLGTTALNYGVGEYKASQQRKAARKEARETKREADELRKESEQANYKSKIRSNRINSVRNMTQGRSGTILGGGVNLGTNNTPQNNNSKTLLGL